MQELINSHEYPIKNILDVLLKDGTTNKNIIFATNEYSNINKTLLYIERIVLVYTNFSTYSKYYKDLSKKEALENVSQVLLS